MAENNIDNLSIEALRERVHKLEEENRRWMHLAGTNRLTDLPNNMMLFKVVIPAELKKWDGKEMNLSLLLISPDNLGELNQQHGRAIGDQFIQEMAKFLQDQIGQGERLFHPDGSNFAILMEGVAGGRARRKATEIKTLFHENTFKVADKEFENMTCSLGVASIEETVPKEDTQAIVDLLYNNLSNGLYKAKQRGGNMVG